MGWWEKTRTFIDLRIKLLGSILTLVVVIGLVLSHFVHLVEDLLVRENLLSALLVVLMVMVLDRLVELHPQAPEPAVQLCENSVQVSSTLQRYIESRTPARADLIEYSAVNVSDLLKRLRNANCEIRLLLQHPEDAPTEFQRSRIRGSVDNMLKVTFKQYNRVQIRYYRVPASVRGRCFDDDQVILGWYRHIAGDTGIEGDDNPMFAAIGHTAEGRGLVKWFRQAFDDLWRHPATVPIGNSMPPAVESGP